MTWRDSIGKKFGKWRVISDAGCTPYRKRLVNVKCRCGFETVVQLQNLTNGASKGCHSCGKKGKPSNRKTHGKATRKPAEYRIWRGMWQRCTNPNCKDYVRYGALGVVVDARWRGPEGFQNFSKDMGKRPSKKYSLDRINPFGNYAPDNCRWATVMQQARNKRNNYHPSGSGGWIKYQPSKTRIKI